MSPTGLRELWPQQVPRSIHKRVSTDAKSGLIRAHCCSSRSAVLARPPAHAGSPQQTLRPRTPPRARSERSRHWRQQVGTKRSQARLVGPSPGTAHGRCQDPRALAAFSRGLAEAPIRGREGAGGPRSPAGSLNFTGLCAQGPSFGRGLASGEARLPSAAKRKFSRCRGAPNGPRLLTKRS